MHWKLGVNIDADSGLQWEWSDVTSISRTNHLMRRSNGMVGKYAKQPWAGIMHAPVTEKNMAHPQPPLHGKGPWWGKCCQMEEEKKGRMWERRPALHISLVLSQHKKLTMTLELFQSHPNPRSWMPCWKQWKYYIPHALMIWGMAILLWHGSQCNTEGGKKNDCQPSSARRISLAGDKLQESLNKELSRSAEGKILIWEKIPESLDREERYWYHANPIDTSTHPQPALASDELMCICILGIRISSHRNRVGSLPAQKKWTLIKNPWCLSQREEGISLWFL